MQKGMTFALLVVGIAMIFAAGCTSKNTSVATTPITTITGDQAAMNKMVLMNNYLSPLMTSFGNAMQSGNYTTARSSAVSIKEYIDENLPEMRQLANETTSQQTVTQEYVWGLEDLQSGMNAVIPALDDYNSGNTTGGTPLLTAAGLDIQNATQYFQNINADLTPG